jgi:hypothetical protein
MHVLYCDDIRWEISNKSSLIGVYNGVLFVTEFPVVLPKLMVAITVMTEVADPFQSLSVTLFRGDEPISEISVPPEDLSKAAQSGQLSPPIEDSSSLKGFPLSSFNAVMSMAPFPIEKATILRAIARTEAGELRGPVLRIALFPDATGAVASSVVGAETPVH